MKNMSKLFSINSFSTGEEMKKVKSNQNYQFLRHSRQKVTNLTGEAVRQSAIIAIIGNNQQCCRQNKNWDLTK